MLQTWLRMASTRNACHSSGRSNHSGPPASATATSQRFFRIVIGPRGDLAAEINSKAPEGFTAGASTRRGCWRSSGLAGRYRCVGDSGIGAIAAAGPIVAALAGAGAAGATGGLVGGLIGAGIPEIEAKRYAGRVREGAYLLSVHCDDAKWAKAEEILEATGGKDVVKTSEASADYRP